MPAILHLACGSVRQTRKVPVKACEYPLRGQTVTGYGKAMPTPYMVFFNSRWRRVKMCCYSNASTMYIGNMFKDETTVLVQYIQDFVE